MQDIISAAEMAHLLGKEVSLLAKHQFPPTAEERRRVHEIYWRKYDQSLVASIAFLREAGIVLGDLTACSADRQTVERLLDELGGDPEPRADAEKVIRRLTATNRLFELGKKHGKPTRLVIERCLRTFESLPPTRPTGHRWRCQSSPRRRC